LKIGILGTGDVGTNLGARFVQLGHEVKLGSRTEEKAQKWAQGKGPKAYGGTFADAAAFAEVVFNCTSGSVSLEALKLAGEKNLSGKVLVDVANALNFSNGELTLTVANTDSLGEQIQRAFPSAKVVKALNTMNIRVQVDPNIVHGESDVFICGNDSGAKTKVTEILGWLGWKAPIDLGGIDRARGMEALFLFWYSLRVKYQSALFNFKIVR
jgi:predicted dinucleotide-binding enzyme